MGHQERQPLLSPQNPPSYDSIINDSYDVTFTGSSPRRIPAIDCRVCHATIDCTGRTQVRFFIKYLIKSNEFKQNIQILKIAQILSYNSSLYVPFEFALEETEKVTLNRLFQQHVVRCTTCNETTPLKAAPPGKRYIRCNCNCLLICTENALR